MNQLPAILDQEREVDAYGDSTVVPSLVVAGSKARCRFLEFFAANIRNPHTHRA